MEHGEGCNCESEQESAEKSYKIIQELFLDLGQDIEKTMQIFDLFNENLISFFNQEVLYEFMGYRVEYLQDKMKLVKNRLDLPPEIGEMIRNKNSEYITIWLDGFMARGMLEERARDESRK
jgi:hypothetical protein